MRRPSPRFPTSPKIRTTDTAPRLSCFLAVLRVFCSNNRTSSICVDEAVLEDSRQLQRVLPRRNASDGTKGCCSTLQQILIQLKQSTTVWASVTGADYTTTSAVGSELLEPQWLGTCYEPKWITSALVLALQSVPKPHYLGEAAAVAAAAAHHSSTPGCVALTSHDHPAGQQNNTRATFTCHQDPRLGCSGLRCISSAGRYSSNCADLIPYAHLALSSISGQSALLATASQAQHTVPYLIRVKVYVVIQPCSTTLWRCV